MKTELKNNVMSINCKNCESIAQGNYCNSCGQRTSVYKVTFKETIQDFVDAVFSVNSPLLLTIKLLVINPGKLFREYLQGKRKSYYKPVPFFILTTIVFVLVKALLDYDPMEGMAIAGSEKIDMNLFNNAGIFMAKNSNNIIFVFVFTFALAIKLLFFKRYQLAEYLAVAFYIIAFYIIVTILSMFYLKYVNTEYKMIPFIILFFYMIYALNSFFKGNIILVSVKSALAYIISIFFYMMLGYGISLLIVWLKTK